jgi:cytochrome c oxidase subunit IV
VKLANQPEKQREAIQAFLKVRTITVLQNNITFLVEHFYLKAVGI